MAAQSAKKKQEDVYAWDGTDKRGNRVKGEIRGKNINLVKAELRRQGVNPNKVRKKQKPLFVNKKKITSKDISVFSRQLATMMSAGVPLVQSIDIVGKGHDNASVGEMLMAIKVEIEGGSNLSQALRKHPLYFDDLFCNLVDAGEQGGILESLLHKIAHYKEKTESLKGKIKKAMTYPTAVIVAAFIVTAILLIYVVPQFEDMFQSFGADLPAFTQMVVDLSRFMQDWWWALFGGIVVGYLAFSYTYKRSRKMRQFLDKMLLQVPIIGVIINKAAIARFARTLGTMFSAGVPLVEAMESVAGATGNIVYHDAVLKMRDDVATGQQLEFAMKQTELFPHMVAQMVAIGEESGALDAMLGKVADFYEEEVDNMVDNLSALIEPIIMAVLGVLVGGLIISMYLPIFKMGQVI